MGSVTLTKLVPIVSDSSARRARRATAMLSEECRISTEDMSDTVMVPVVYRENVRTNKYSEQRSDAAGNSGGLGEFPQAMICPCGQEFLCDKSGE